MTTVDVTTGRAQASRSRPAARSRRTSSCRARAATSRSCPRSRSRSTTHLQVDFVRLPAKSQFDMALVVSDAAGNAATASGVRAGCSEAGRGRRPRCSRAAACLDRGGAGRGVRLGRPAGGRLGRGCRRPGGLDADDLRRRGHRQHRRRDDPQPRGVRRAAGDAERQHRGAGRPAGAERAGLPALDAARRGAVHHREAAGPRRQQVERGARPRRGLDGPPGRARPGSSTRRPAGTPRASTAWSSPTTAPVSRAATSTPARRARRT